jgi:PhnB protein
MIVVEVGPSPNLKERLMPQLDNYLFFDGNCAEAMRFYHRVLGGEMQKMMTYAESPEPEQCAPATADRIMHACIVLEGRMLMASDCQPGQYQPPQGFALSLSYKTADEARRVFDQLANGGQVLMPMAETFWVDIFGMVKDRFGIPWMVGGGQQKAG